MVPGNRITDGIQLLTGGPPAGTSAGVVPSDEGTKGCVRASQRTRRNLPETPDAGVRPHAQYRRSTLQVARHARLRSLDQDTWQLASISNRAGVCRSGGLGKTRRSRRNVQHVIPSEGRH
jgi:hypothetical protein